jgi:3-hydroxyacyl-CoA dehydrogenase
VKRKKVTRVQGEKWMSGLIATTDYNHLRKADIIIEAVFEDLALKHKVIKEVRSLNL